MKMMTITDRAILWNSQRYDQVWNHELAVKLLLEETEETVKAMLAGNRVEVLDGVGDIFFVAIGVFWKLGFTEEQVNIIFHQADLGSLTLLECDIYMDHVMLNCIDVLEAIEAKSGERNHACTAITLALHCCFTVGLNALRCMGLQHEVYNIVHVICNSNATKAIKGKTDPTVKANIDKGSSFIPPTEALRKILTSNDANVTNAIGSIN
jgi:hypothetical protein